MPKGVFPRKPYSEEHKRNIGLVQKGKIFSEEYRKKLSISAKGRIFSEEHRKNLSISHTKYPGKNRTDRFLRFRYNLTEEEYNELLKNQNNVCKICGKPESGKVRGENRRLSVDHDHETGKVRGLLCGRCNRKLGVYESIKREKLDLDGYLNSK